MLFGVSQGTDRRNRNFVQSKVGSAVHFVVSAPLKDPYELALFVLGTPEAGSGR